MKLILVTLIKAPIKTCFDLSRSIDFHVKSMKKTNEQAIAGITEGLINLNESVTWQATHFGIKFKMTIKITEVNEPSYFIDEMIKGPFKTLKHQHKFKSVGLNTKMTDVFECNAPFGLLGKLVEKIFLKSYMQKLLTARNALIKKVAENANAI